LPDVDPAALEAVHREWDATWMQNGGVGTQPSTLLTCAVPQLVGAGSFDPSCASASATSLGVYSYASDATSGCTSASEAGWCYATAVGDCKQTLEFSATSTTIPNATLTLSCCQ
jgi:hypothetical protein